MPSNKAAVLTARHCIDLLDWPMPVATAGSVVVEVAACGVCGSDVHFFELGRIGETVVDAPLILGHEAAGTIVEVGEGVGRDRIGRRVAIEPGESCGQCRECLTGRSNLCASVRYFSAPPVHGAFQRYLAIPSRLAHGIPDTLSFEAAGLMEPLSVVLWACQKARVMAGDRVLVTGAGPIGNLAAQMARLNGAVEVVVVDISPPRLEAALACGATAVIDNREGGLEAVDGDFDVLLECVGHAGLTEAAIRHVRPAGRAVLVGMSPHPSMPLPIATLQAREIDIVGTFRFANTYERCLRIAGAGLVKLDEIVNARFDLAQTAEALSVSRSRNDVIKAMVYPGR